MYSGFINLSLFCPMDVLSLLPSVLKIHDVLGSKVAAARAEKLDPILNQLSTADSIAYLESELRRWVPLNFPPLTQRDVESILDSLPGEPEQRREFLAQISAVFLVLHVNGITLPKDV